MDTDLRIHSFRERLPADDDHIRGSRYDALQALRVQRQQFKGGIDRFASTNTTGIFNMRCLPFCGKEAVEVYLGPEEVRKWYAKPYGHATDVLIIGGESGSGKTMCLLWPLANGAIGLYLTAKDFESVNWSEEAQSKNHADARNAAVLEVIAEFICKVLGKKGLQTLSLADKDPVELVVAFDEMGVYPTFVRGLCSVFQEQQHIISAVEAKSASRLQDVRFRFAAAGTGCGADSIPPGSMSNTFCLVALRTNASTTERISDYLKKYPLMKWAFDRCNIAHELASNPRVGAAICNQIEMCPLGSVPTSRRSALAMLVAVLRGACGKYRELNGMKGCPQSAIANLRATALTAIFTKTTELNTAIKDCIVNRGVLTDTATWCKKSEPVGPGLRVLLESGLMMQVCQTPRFRMSAAQAWLFRCSFGFDVVSPNTWESLEGTVAHYFEIALIGCRGRTTTTRDVAPQSEKTSGATLSTLLEHIGNAATHADAAEYLGLPLNYCGVATAFASSKLEHVPAGKSSAKADEVKLHLKRFVDANTAVVLVNADNASFADVIVLIPKTAVILVQCKFTAESASIGFKGEMAKMGYGKKSASASLCKDLLDLCGAKLILRCFASTKSEPAAVGKPYAYWHMKTMTLEPLSTPQKGPAFYDADAVDVVAAYKLTEAGTWITSSCDGGGVPSPAAQL